ncbi:9734_t:CDS:10 [Ambispora gerdemannii]|uniref:9734_t:CDS:1 n=1 Tax=Ambispora gerdemannii TaxID=144530 RepID=A0A9N9FIF1_9GLOM|nr:9734_t:CDS:10 [Ambispora gerdemannii]
MEKSIYVTAYNAFPATDSRIRIFKNANPNLPNLWSYFHVTTNDGSKNIDTPVSLLNVQVEANVVDIEVKEYREAVSQGKGAYLLEENLPDVFQCSLVRKNPFRLTNCCFASILTWRFSEDVTNGKIVTAANPSYASTEIAKYTLGLSITFRMTDTITSIESPSHLISTELNINGDAKVSRTSLAEEITYLERDFILVVESNGLDESRAFIEHNPKTETNAVMLTLVPNFHKVSGSMSGRRASQALQLILRSLPKIVLSISFLLGAYLIPCLKKVNKSFLEWVVKTARSDMPTSVFLLTDGKVRNVDEIVQLIQKTANNPKKTFRLFSLGIGSSVSHHLIESIARAGKGYSEFVTDEERMDRKVIGMVKNAIKNALTDYKVEWIDETPTDSKKRLSISSFPLDSSKKNETKFCQAPNSIPAIYSGVRVVVYAILAKGVEPKKIINLSAQSLDSPIKLDVKVDPVTLQGSQIHTLAARKLIRDLEEGTSNLHADSTEKDKVSDDLALSKNKLFVLLSVLRQDIPAINEKTNSEIARSETLKQKGEVPGQLKYHTSSAPMHIQGVSYAHAHTPTIKTLYEFLKLNHSMETVAIAYLEIVMKEFKEEWEFCYEKAERVLTNLIEKKDKSKKVENIVAETHEWVQSGLQVNETAQ